MIDYRTTTPKHGRLPDHQEICFGCVSNLLRQILSGIPIRCLAQSLIFILILISPLSFSRDEIHNFTYECPVSRGYSIKINKAVAIQRTAVSTAETPIPVTNQYLQSAAPSVPLTLHYNTSHSRAPPA